jgi:hypothetical protein
MADPTGANCPGPCAYQLQAAFLLILPRIETHARVWSRHLACPGQRDDFVSEAVALAWKSFLRLAEWDRDATQFASAVASLAVRAVRSGRRLCGQERSRDVLSHTAQRRGGFRVEGLLPSQVHETPCGQRYQDAFEERLRDNTVTPPDEQAAFRIDYRVWLSQLGERNRRIAQDMALDHLTRDLSMRHKLSQGRISQLRREFHLDWRRFHGEAL